MLMPMARIPKAIWLPLDAVDQDIFSKSNKKGSCMQSTYPRLLGISMPKFNQQSSLLAILPKDQNCVILQTVGFQMRWKLPYNDRSLDEVTRKKARTPAIKAIDVQVSLQQSYVLQSPS